MRPLNHIVSLVILVATLAAGCTTSSKLPPGKRLLKKQEVVFRPKNKQAETMKSALDAKLSPQPNSSILGLKVRLFFYNLVKEPKGKGVRYFIRNKMGQPPVFASRVSIPVNISYINSEMENNGFFRISTKVDTTTKNRKKTFTYVADAGVRYRIRNVIYPLDSTLAASKLIVESSRKTLLKEGAHYDLGDIADERIRIDDYLKQQGYYNFNPEYLEVQADTNHQGQVDLYIRLKQGVPKTALIPYYIDSIKVYPTYTVKSDSLLHTIKGKMAYNLEVVDPTDRYKPLVFAHAIMFRPGDLFSKNIHTNSLSRLININAFQFVNLKYHESDTGKLNATFQLTPAKRKSISLGLTTSSQSNDYYNGDLKLSLKNRNIFKGAELFEMNVSAGIDTQFGGAKTGDNAYTFSGGFNITAPRLISPIKSFNWMKLLATKTQASLKYEMLIRNPHYTIHSFTSSWGYIWKVHQKDEHNLTLVNLNYLRPSNLSYQFDSALQVNPWLKNSVTKQLIMSSIYSFTYTNQSQPEKKHQYYFNTSGELSGNILDLIKKKPADGGQKEVLGVPFAQFARTIVDYRSYLRMGRSSIWANRLYLGIGIPYSNSQTIPFIRQFYSGGPNGLRGFRAYTVGPGTYKSSEDIIKNNETGDMKIEFGSEYRFGIYSIIKGAVFADAGNIWMIESMDGREGSKFKFNSFYKELYVSGGVGLRFDVTFLILRLDFGIPLRIGHLPEGERWVLHKIDFGSKEWRNDNLILNVAIGYPF